MKFRKHHAQEIKKMAQSSDSQEYSKPTQIKERKWPQNQEGKKQTSTLP